MSRLPPTRAAAFARLAMLGTVICLGLLMFPLGAWWIAGVRFIAGIVSAISMIAASVWLLQVIEHAQGAPLLFSGVGLGIFISAELIAVCSATNVHSSVIWIALAAVGTILLVIAWPVLGRKPADPGHATPAEPTDIRVPINPWILVLVYGLAGFGYIVTATYLPVLIRIAAPDISPLQVWAGFGIGAMPSCFFWHSLHMKLGTRRAMFFNLGCQAIGVVVPIFAANLAGYLTSALMVGGTFVGTVTIAMPAARRLAPRLRFNILASMTAAYGIGQIIGPLVAGLLVSHTQSFFGALVSAGVTLIGAAVLSLAM